MAILTAGRFRTGHWYTAGGRPVHRVPKADGSGDRPTTLADARVHGFYPSVTGILDVFDKPGLMNWKLDQVALAAARTPRQPEEGEKYWCGRVRDTAFEPVDQAADRGSAIHAALELAADGQPYDPALEPYIRQVLAWKKEAGLIFIEREKVVVNKVHGFAGMCDVFFRWGANGIGVLDYKTTKLAKGEEPNVYIEHAMQLAAYAATYWGEENLPKVLAANVFISSSEPDVYKVKRQESLVPAWEAFKQAAALWRYYKGYDPRTVAQVPVIPAV